MTLTLIGGVDCWRRGTSYDTRPRCGVKGYDVHLPTQSQREKCPWLTSCLTNLCRPYLSVRKVDEVHEPNIYHPGSLPLLIIEKYLLRSRCCCSHANTLPTRSSACITLIHTYVLTWITVPTAGGVFELLSKSRSWST